MTHFKSQPFNKRSSFGQQLNALLMRNLLLKKRNRGRTIMEMIFPIYMALILLIIKSSTNLKPLKAIDEPIGGGSNWPNNDLFSNKTWLAVNANNNNMNKRIIDSLNSLIQEMDYGINFNDSFNSSESAEFYYRSHKNKVCLAVIFGNNSETNISYILRMPYNSVPISNDIKGRIDECRDFPFLWPCQQMKYYQSGFTFAQTIIDSAIIKVLDVNATVIPKSKLLIFPKPEFNSDNKLWLSFVPTYLAWGFTPLVSILTVMFVMEKERKIKEGMFMMGLRMSAYWLSWIITQGIIVLLLSIIVTVIIFFTNLIENINPLIIFILLFAFGMSMISISALLSPFFEKEKIAGSFASFFTLFAGLIHLLVVFLDIPIYAYYILALLSPCAFTFGASSITRRSIEQNTYIDFDNIFEDTNFSLGLAIFYIIFDSLIYSLLAVYFDQVIPGEFGPKQSFYYIFDKTYWSSLKSNHFGYSRNENIDDECSDVEEVSSDLKGKTAIVIEKISKKFGKGKKQSMAIDKISLNIYESQITGILGHNGAGKSTLINMLVGTIRPSSGTATIYGYDINVANDMNKLRSMFGVCLQHDILFDDLNSEEHLNFFGAMKGVKRENLCVQVKMLLTQVGLFKYHKTCAKNLSGGQKRKLCIAIALIGNPKIILLDEPTSGIDAYSRRQLWSLLQSYKKDRVIILTTHFMDEADILSDRKAIISKGKLRCVGSSLFLKNRFGIGYHLVVDVKNDTDVEYVTNLVTTNIDNSRFDRFTGSELFYILPLSQTQRFPQLFDALENQISSQISGIKSYGISMTTLEEVFLKLEEVECETEVKQNSNFKSDMVNSESPTYKCEPHFNKSFSSFLYLRLLIFIRNPMHILPIIILPIIMILISFALMKTSNTTNPTALNLLIDSKIYNNESVLLYHILDKSKVDVPFFTSSLAKLGIKAKSINNLTLNTLSDSYMATDILQFSNDWNFNWLFNDTYYHSLPILQNIFSNLYLFFINKNDTNYKLTPIQIYNHPFSQLDDEESVYKFDSKVYTYLILMAVMLGSIPPSIAVEVVEDRELKIKDLLRVCGLTFNAYWITTIVCHLIMFSISTILILVFMIVVLKLDFLQYTEAIVCIIILFILFMPASLLTSYVLSYLFNKRDTARSILPLICYLPSMFMILFVIIITSVNLKIGILLHQIFCFVFPFYVPQGCLFWIAATSQKKKYYQSFGDVSFFDWNENIIICFIALIFHILLLSWVLPIVDNLKSGTSVFELFGIKSAVMATNNEQSSELEDDDVRRERANVDNCLTNGVDQHFPIVLLHNLSKEYYQNDLFSKCKSKSKPIAAVNNLSVMVESGHIFGLLGPNGAGKTTTIKIIIRDERQTNGSVMIAGQKVESSISNIFQLIGYCPQHEALWKEITVREHLALYAAIRGIQSKHIKPVCNQYMNYLKIEQFADKRVEQLSGGTKRKLCYLISLLGQPKLVLLDEPSTGMDPKAKRFLWDTIKSVFQRNSEKCAILTTHSMEEADALCTKLAIMVNGVMRCIGSTQHLKNKYGAGYILEIKWNQSNNSINITEIKQFVLSIFRQITIKEEYDNKIIYSVPQDSVESLSSIFNSLENMRKTINCIEDYSFSQSTIEQVFIGFAKQQN